MYSKASPYILFICLWALNCLLKPAQAKTLIPPKDKDQSMFSLPEHLDIRIQASPQSHDDPQHIIEIPFKLSGSLLLIEAKVNSLRGSFIFDSGAPDLKLNSHHFQKGRKVSSHQAQGLTGRIHDLRLINIESFNWAGITLKNISVEAFDLSHIEKVRQEKILGLIGFQVFKDFEIHLDYKYSRILLYSLDKEGNPLQASSLENHPDYRIGFKLRGHVPIIQTQIGSHTLSFGLDTGAEMNILDIRNKAKVLKHFSIRKRGLLNGNGQKKIEVFSGKIDRLAIQNLVYYEMRALLGNMEEINQAFQTDLDGILGFEFLSRRPIAINFKKKELLIWSEISRLKRSKVLYLESKKSKL